MNDKLRSFNSFLEGIKTKDLSSIPGKQPGERDYIADVTARAKERMGIGAEREGDMGSIHRSAGPLMAELGRSQALSRGYERDLERLATQVITDLYKPLIDYYNIKLDIRIATGPEIRRMLDEDMAKQKEEGPKPKSQRPIIKARGADFSMLIHEAVKGMWRVISMGSVPKDPEIAKAIESQFGLADEPDDWRYGPEIAADLRDFVNQNPKTDLYKNVREELWKYMIDERNLPTEKFLDLMKGILSNTREARIKVDSLIDIVIEKIKKREEYLEELADYERKMAEYEKQMAEYNKKMEEYKKGQPIPRITKKEEPEVIDYSKMSQRDLNDELSKALDNRDMETVKIISKYLK
jgi:hypothetical protein